VSVTGTFVPQNFEGVARAAGSAYQFLICKDLALVAVIPDGIIPEADRRYQVIGSLRCTGLYGMFPGIEIAEIVAI
jgi:hypothetical protein